MIKISNFSWLLYQSYFVSLYSERSGAANAAASSDLSIYKDTSNCQLRKNGKNALFSEFDF